MKILVITGSAHKKGTSAWLADEFSKGAEEAGHEVYRFDAAYRDVHPCIACERCHTTDKGCTFRDDMNELNPQLLEADVVAFVSPVYYFDINAQLKAVIDRFYANDKALHGGKKAVLMVSMYDDTIATAEGAIASFKSTAAYLGWENAGVIAATGCGSVDDMKKTDFPQQAYELGKNL